LGINSSTSDISGHHEKIRRFFDLSLREHPASSPAIVGWSTVETQRLRFKVLSEIADLTGTRILDVGCGVGDLFGYLQANHKEVDYLGIDLHSGMVAHATRKYPEGIFLHQSLERVEETFDYVFVSGAFNLRVDDNEKYLQTMIQLCYSAAKKGVAFNLLSRYAPNDSIYLDLYYYDPGIVFSYCKKIAENVMLRHDYLSNDFSIYMYK